MRKRVLNKLSRVNVTFTLSEYGHAKKNQEEGPLVRDKRERGNKVGAICGFYAAKKEIFSPLHCKSKHLTKFTQKLGQCVLCFHTKIVFIIH